MQTFTDTAGHVWRVPLTIGQCRRIKDRLSVDLLAVTSAADTTLQQLGTDTDMLLKVLWEIISAQAHEHGVSEIDFWDRVDDTVLETAVAALTEALIGFFRPGRREVIRAALGLQTKHELAVAQALAEKSPVAGAAADAIANSLLTPGN